MGPGKGKGGKSTPASPCCSPDSRSQLLQTKRKAPLRKRKQGGRESAPSTTSIEVCISQGIVKKSRRPTRVAERGLKTKRRVPFASSRIHPSPKGRESAKEVYEKGGNGVLEGSPECNRVQNCCKRLERTVSQREPWRETAREGRRGKGRWKSASKRVSIARRFFLGVLQGARSHQSSREWVRAKPVWGKGYRDYERKVTGGKIARIHYQTF